MPTEKPHLLKRKRGGLPVIPQHMRLSKKDVDEVVAHLRVQVRRMRWISQSNPDRLFLSTRCVLSDQEVKNIVQDFHLVTSMDILSQRLVGWRYWDTLGLALWNVVDKISLEMRSVLKKRHELKLARDRQGRQDKREAKEAREAREYVEEHGLLHIKRVRLHIPGDGPTHNKPAVTLTASVDGNRQLPASALLSQRLHSPLPAKRLAEDMHCASAPAANLRRMQPEVSQSTTIVFSAIDNVSSAGCFIYHTSSSVFLKQGKLHYVYIAISQIN